MIIANPTWRPSWIRSIKLSTLNRWTLTLKARFTFLYNMARFENLNSVFVFRCKSLFLRQDLIDGLSSLLEMMTKEALPSHLIKLLFARPAEFSNLISLRMQTYFRRSFFSDRRNYVCIHRLERNICQRFSHLPIRSSAGFNKLYWVHQISNYAIINSLKKWTVDTLTYLGE